MNISNEKLNFLFISSDTYPPFRVDVEVLFGREFVKRGHRIDWILQSSEACFKSFTADWCNSKVWVGKTDLGTSKFAKFKKHLYGILHDLIMFGLAKKNNYDFIQVKDKFISALLGLICAKYHNIGFVYWLSYPFPEAALYKYKENLAKYPIIYLIRGKIFSFLLYKIILPNSTHVFVQSEQMKKDIRNKKIDSNKITPVPMGISIEEFDKLSIEKKDFSDKLSIVYLGTLSRVRKIDFLIRVHYEVTKTFKNAFLYLVGDGDDQLDNEIIYNEAKKLGIVSKIKITGFMPRKDALSYVASASVCVSPFYPTPILNSTSPTKIIEYMAMGRPVVANDHPEQSMIITTSKCGICVPYSELDFASAICKLLSNSKDSEEMGKNGRRYVESFRDYSHISENVESKYYEIFNVS